MKWFNDMTLLSVVTPTYQRPELVALRLQAYLAAIGQAARETQTSFECIVVDDHSPGDAFERLQQQFRGTPGLRCLQLPSNVGPGPARDTGLAHAHAQWI